MAAQKLWELVITYCRDMHDIDIHPLAMLMMTLDSLSSLADMEITDAELKTRVDTVHRAILDCVEETVREAANTIRDSHVPVEHYELDNDRVWTADALVQEYFRVFQKLKTFHRDITKYETEEEVALHKRLMAVYERLAETVDLN